MSFRFSSFSSFLSSSRVFLTLFILTVLFLFHLIPFYFSLGPKISGRDLLLVEECCNAPDSMRQVSSSYSSLLPCHLLACCILPCHHLHFICMFFKTCIRSFSPLSVSRSDTLARARRPSQTLFHEREKNVLGMGRDLPSGLGIAPTDRPSNFVPFGGRLMPQRLTA